MKKGNFQLSRPQSSPSSLCPYLYTDLMDCWKRHDLSRPVIYHSDSHTDAQHHQSSQDPSSEYGQDRTLVLSPSDTTTFTSTHSSSFWCSSVPQNTNKNPSELELEVRVHLGRTMRTLSWSVGIVTPTNSFK